MAECIRDDWQAGPVKRPRVGDVAMVERVITGRSSAGERGVGLRLFRFAGAWDAGAFRQLPRARRPAVASALAGRLGQHSEA